MPREWTDDERRRADEEEQAHYWDSVEEERRAEEAKQEARQAAVEEMVGWFHEQFEDPQVETPRDSEDDSYIYPWGGPFGASDVLYGMFREEHDEELIQQAIKSVESDGTTEWAPTSSGEYYEHPQPDDNESGAIPALSQLTASALERLDALEAIVAALPGVSSQIGHNAPPEAIGIPPYTDEDGHAATAAIAETRAALATQDPNPAELATLARRFDGWGTKIAAWLGKKADLAVDEAIKNSVRAFTWSQAAGAFAATAGILVELAKHLLAHR
jgi:hypothetical protein